MDELIRLLEQQCARLEHIRYRTSVALLLLRGGESRFLPQAADEIHDAVDQLSQTELLRAAAVSVLADELGVPDDSLTLEGIIGHASAERASQLRALSERLREALSDLQDLTTTGTAVAASELESIRRSLGRWSGGASGLGGYGAVLAPPVVPSRFDGAF